MSGYAEFKEAYMKLEERLRPRWKEYRREGLKEGRKQALALFEQGWTLEQVKAKFDQEQAGEQAD